MSKILVIRPPESWGPIAGDSEMFYREHEDVVESRTLGTDWRPSAVWRFGDAATLQGVIDFYVDPADLEPWRYELLMEDEFDAILRAD